MSDASVAPGQMRLYDDVRPALLDDTYMLTASTDFGRGDFVVSPKSAYFAIVGPRFTLPASEIAAVHPPRNAQGGFSEVFPHLVLGRRTLPWERELDSGGAIPEPTPDPLDPEPVPLREKRTPWLALLLFVDDPAKREITVLPQPVNLSTVAPKVFASYHLGSADPLVDAIEVDARLLRQVMPSKEEVQLLCHARQVNVDDRELAAGDSDGWFAVVTANRLPTPGLRHRACLVSLENRSDVVFPSPPQLGEALPPAGPVRLVLLHSWTFNADTARPGGGTFKELTQLRDSSGRGLDVGLTGRGAAALTDTGHLPLTLQDRTGNQQTVWYRGPLSPHPVARDPLGPYHSADQARRVSPETGTEDISYAAAFELGRLLAAADGRLAQDLMQWRREAYRRSARQSVASKVWADVPSIATPSQQALSTGMAAPVALTVFERAGAGAGQSADLTGAQTVQAAPGLQPTRLANAWNLTVDQVAKFLTDPTHPQPPTPPPAPTFAAPSNEVVDELQKARNRLLGAPTTTGRPAE